MNWIAWAIIGVILLIALVILYAALAEEKRRRAYWDEYRHPPDSEVEQDEHD
jgi:protein-S-isoprenylcysteine O-methyltransferase Ste14